MANDNIDSDIKNIAKDWKKLSGLENHWKNSLDPPSTDLRLYINHYGELAEATYDAYIKTPHSKNAGNVRYSRKNLMTKVGLTQGRPLNEYKVTKYLYATSAVMLPGAFVTSSSPQAWSKKSNWIGFIGVANDEGKKALGRRDILVAWRGTVNPSDMIHDAELLPVPAPKIFGLLHKDNPKVHNGWYSIYSTHDENTRYNKQSARDQAIDEVKKLVNEYRNEEISLTLTGHSMGAAIATLNAVDIVFHGLNKQTVTPPISCPVTVFAFACPKVGDDGFSKVFKSMKDLYCLRINNVPDVVPKYPMVGYSDVGSELVIDTVKSTYLKGPGDPGSWHSMEGYMHGVAGVQGKKGGFKLEVNRDLSLVNKFSDALMDKYGIPPAWWTEKHSGMVQNPDGHWELKDHEEDNDP
ncbi:phospholipase A1-II 1-like [Rutidosis leptorrhynchoides]|uniref:phospholipase A1-II 1-like n=1 Tax=Rutidosis leptorrhynchoides TaxID=125765 RepID=UPI003A98F6A6